MHAALHKVNPTIPWGHEKKTNTCLHAYADMSAQQLMERGRKEMKAQDESLIRAQRIVESTIEVGTKTAETLQAQGEQMDRVLDTLEEIRFDMKKAGQVIRDITRGLATDKCAHCASSLNLVYFQRKVAVVCCLTTDKSAWPACAWGTSLCPTHSMERQEPKA